MFKFYLNVLLFFGAKSCVVLCCVVLCCVVLCCVVLCCVVLCCVVLCGGRVMLDIPILA